MAGVDRLGVGLGAEGRTVGENSAVEQEACWAAKLCLDF